MSWQQFDSYFVYILFCPLTGKSYVGHTSNLILRFQEHRQGLSRWTRALKQPLCVHWEACASRGAALQREKFLKSGKGFEERWQFIREGQAVFGCSGVPPGPPPT